MPDLNHKFHAGKMNKDLDERLVPNGEYRDALNVQVATSDGSDVGSLQNLLGNLDISSKFYLNQKGEPIDKKTLETYGFYCVGSITDEKNDKLYWLVSGAGIDFIAEYDYKTKIVSPIIVDIFQVNLLPGDKGRVLHFDKSYLITGINIIEETLFWTDNNTEPKKIKIPEIRIGTSNFFTHTDFYVPNPDKQSNIPYILSGPIKHEHITVIKKGPQIAPKLEMKNTTRDDQFGSDPMIGEIQTTLTGSLLGWFDQSTGKFTTDILGVTFESAPDFKETDKLVIESLQRTTGVLKKTKMIVQIMSEPAYVINANGTNVLACNIIILSYDQNMDLDDDLFNVYLLQEKSLFEFRFPRFACRYKYKDGEYSAFSPFTEVAFLPGKFDYLPKEGYNLGMVNTIRELGVCDFVDERSIPDDVVAIDILYKESNSPNIYSVKTIDRIAINQGPPAVYDSWNATSASQLRDTTLLPLQRTYGYVNIEAEMIHSLLPSNQLLRGWDNVPRKALAQEVVGNRLVYANYLQNYNMSSSQRQQPSALYSTSGTGLAFSTSPSIFHPDKNISVDLKLNARSSNITTTNIPEQINPGNAYSYKPAKTIKSLRTYQLGVVYIDEFGRETPVFSESKKNRNTTYVEKISAPQQTKLRAHVFSPKPDFAKSFKFLIKETSSEYYNLAMDRWYPAEDGNIWLSFPSSDRNKVDLETFLILKKAHDSSIAITDLARYKILDIDNEVPTFVKTKRTAVKKVTDGFADPCGALFLAPNCDTIPILMTGGLSDTNWPYIDGTFVQIESSIFVNQITIWDQEGADSTEKQFRIVSTEGASDWYGVKHWEEKPAGYYTITADRKFGVDMSITTPYNVPIAAGAAAYSGQKVEFVKKEVKILPEFEGRFFVKILKDATLQEHIIGYAGIQSIYTSINQFKVQYINPTEANCVDPNGIYHPDSTSGGGSWYGYGQGNLGKISIDDNNTETGFHPASCGNGDGGNYWKNAGATGYANSKSSGWFIDKIEAFRPYSYNRLFFNRIGNSYDSDYNNPSTGWREATPPYLSHTLSTYGAPWGSNDAEASGMYGLNGDLMGIKHNGNNGYMHFDYADDYNMGWNYNAATGNTFYNNHFADDWGITSPAIFQSYQGKPNRQLQLIGDCTNYSSGDTPEGLADGSAGYLGFGDVAIPMNSAGVPYLRMDPIYQNPFKNGKILPAVGCPGLDSTGATINGSVVNSDGSAIITLSFAGLGSVIHWGTGNYNGSYWSNDETTLESYFTDQAFVGNYIKHQTFIDQITTPGTMWRWAEDPDQVVYETQDLPGSSDVIGGATVTIDEWSHNEYDLARWQLTSEKGVGLHNYTKIADYVTTHWVWIDATEDSWHVRANWATQGMGNYKSWSNAGFPDYSAEKIAYPRLNSIVIGAFDDGLNSFKSPNRWPMFTSDFETATNRRRRFFIRAKVKKNITYSSGVPTDGTEGIGGVGPYFYSPTNDSTLLPHFDQSGTRLDPSHANVLANATPGIRPDGMYTTHTNPSGSYSLNHGGTVGTISSTEIPGLKMTDGGTNPDTPAPGSVTWQILEPYAEDGVDEGYFSQNPGVWETEPKEDLGLEIYHEVGQIYPTELNAENVEQFFGPVDSGNPSIDPSFLSKNSKVTCWSPPTNTLTPDGAMVALDTAAGNGDQDKDIRVHLVSVTNGIVQVWLMDINGNPLKPVGAQVTPKVGDRLMFTRADGSVTEVNVKNAPSGSGIIFHNYEVHTDVHNYEVTLPWFNAYSFKNGVESNRIRDDYNQVTIDKGPKVSAVLEEPYAEEHRSSGLIYSGIYNSMSGVNNLNQFIQAEKITKDLNPSYGSIQKLFARNTNLVTFCEDKVFKILANKDALYNADGSINLTATENVLGQTMPFTGDYGISTNPESFAADAYRLYFADRTRGSILRLSQDGMTPISSYGMTDWFADNLSNSNRIIGSFDDNKKEYNVSLSYYDHTVYPVKILGVMQPSGPSLPGQSLPTVPVPSTTLEVKSWIASNFEAGDDITGPGIPIGAIVVGKSNQGAGIWHVQISQLPTNQDIATLEDYTCGDVDCLDLWWNTKLSSSTEITNEKTLSYSDMVKGWPSFKSFHYESGLSLNNDYFTIKGGQLYQHHINNTHNEFYDTQYDSSVEVLFNDTPGFVKSFQALDYEGTQSKITSDGGLSETSHSGEYWDNYNKLGWYVDNMYTDLQEVEPAEFKNKEGKWFSTVQGVTTEWLDDDKAGNIDTKEFSYQGIDESNGITVIDGGYTSWDCQESICGPLDWISGGPSTGLNHVSHPFLNNGGTPAAGEGTIVTNPDCGCDYTNTQLNPCTEDCLFYNADQLENPSTGAIEAAWGGHWKFWHVGDIIKMPSGRIWIFYPSDPSLQHQWSGILPSPEMPIYYNSTNNQTYDSGLFWQECGNVDGGGFNCIEVQNLDGAYPDEASCLADTDSECNTTCDVPNVVIAHANDDISNDCYSDSSIPNGSGAVEVYLAGDATSWTVKYFDAITDNLVLTDPLTYTHNGLSTFSILPTGEYYAVVTDNLGCEEKVMFIIQCTETPFPCDNTTNPHSFTFSNVQNPQWIPSNNDCWRYGDPNISMMSGGFYLTNNGLVTPASYWGYNLYITISGLTTLVSSQTNQSPQSTLVVNGLEEGDYEYEIFDSEGCVYPRESFTLTCYGSACDPPALGQSSTAITNSTSTDACVTDNLDGTHTLLNVMYPGGTGNYYVAYYEYDNSLYSSFPGLTLATQIQAPTGPFTSTSLSPIASISNLSASSISGKDYAVVIATDTSFNCISVNEFTIDCNSDTAIDPCASESSTPVVTHATEHASSYICDDPINPIYLSLGNHTLQTVTIQPAAAGFYVQYFATNGFNTIAGYSNWSVLAAIQQSYMPNSTMVQAAGSSGLIPGDYACEITDAPFGCKKIIFFTVLCETEMTIDPTFDCQNNCNPSSLPLSTVAPFTIFSNQGACLTSNCYLSSASSDISWGGCCDPMSPSLSFAGPNGNIPCYLDIMCECCNSGSPPQYGSSGGTIVMGSAAGCGTTCLPPITTCFVAGTKVTMADGTNKNIEDVEIGEEILAKDGVNKVMGYDRPLLGSRKLYSFNNGKPFVTSEHPFMTIDGWKSIDPIATFKENPDLNVETLNINDVILTQFDPITIENIDIHKGNTDQILYNFVLDGDNTYYADGYLVHNKDVINGNNNY